MSVTGRVTKIEKFGAFIEVEEGLEGLLPISEISWQRVNSVGDVLKENDIIKAAVIGIDTQAKKLTFSLKQAGPIRGRAPPSGTTATTWSKPRSPASSISACSVS